MALPSKPKDNKFHYDQGRLRHKIVVKGDVVVDDGFGGSTPMPDQVILQTWAGKERVSDYKLSNMVGDSTNYDKHQYFVIRNRANFTPLKTMKIEYNGLSYSIIRVDELDDPVTFLWLLCGVSV